MHIRINYFVIVLIGLLLVSVTVALGATGAVIKVSKDELNILKEKNLQYLNVSELSCATEKCNFYVNGVELRFANYEMRKNETVTSHGSGHYKYYFTASELKEQRDKKIKDYLIRVVDAERDNGNVISQAETVQVVEG